MKNLYKLICCAIILAGCVEENLEPIKPAMSGDEIIFGARAGFEDSDQATKTIYSGETYELNGKIFERIDWLDGSDKIEIYCKEAANGPSAHYVINDASTDEEGTDQKDEATLTRIGDGALQWNGDGDHTFYAMYPSSMMFTNDMDKTVETGIFMSSSENSVVVNGIVPSSQQPTVEEIKDENGVGTKNYIAKPDMNYAYMVAKSTASRANGSVGLSFVPIVTAVEIELYNANLVDVNIGEIQVSSDEPIVGSFQANLTDWENGYPGCIITKEPSAEENSIQITTRIAGTGNIPVAVPVRPNHSLKFTVFLLPGATDKQIENLTIGVSITGTSYKEKTLGGANIKQHLKTRISKINLPELTIDGEKWMESVNPLMSFKALSLPGTGGSFTSTADVNFRQQSLTFEQQWKLGIRAFELQSERPSSSDTSLGGQAVTCNKKPVDGYTVYSVLSTLIDKVSGPNANKDENGFTETAALILTYQPKGNNPGRDPEAYAQSLNVMLTKHGTANCLTAEQYKRIISYKPGLTMAEARGNVILICRPTQRDEDADGIFDDVVAALPSNVTAIDGCGSAKDKWKARGYRVNVGKREYFRDTYYYEGAIFGIGAGWRWNNYTYGEYVNMPLLAADISNGVNTSSFREQTESNISGDTASEGAYQKGFEYERDPYVEYYMQQAPLFPIGTATINHDIISIKYTTSYANGMVTRPSALTMPPKDMSEGINFGYKTNNADIICWYQEWARVVPADLISYNVPNGSWKDYSTTIFGNNPTYNYQAINWFESYSEKLSNIITTFNMAISDQYSNYVFINALSGYYADTAEDPTYSLVPSLGNVYGGDGGDVEGLANALNPIFYQYVLHSGMEESTGPTGIVLMDFVSDKEEKGGAFYLPGTIIANNFKFD